MILSIYPVHENILPAWDSLATQSLKCHICLFSISPTIITSLLTNDVVVVSPSGGCGRRVVVEKAAMLAELEILKRHPVRKGPVWHYKCSSRVQDRVIARDRGLGIVHVQMKAGGRG